MTKYQIVKLLHHVQWYLSASAAYHYNACEPIRSISDEEGARMISDILYKYFIKRVTV